jgi:hypothetical protein
MLFDLTAARDLSFEDCNDLVAVGSQRLAGTSDTCLTTETHQCAVCTPMLTMDLTSRVCVNTR